MREHVWINEDFERNELQSAPDKSIEIELMCDHAPPHPAAGLSYSVPEPSTGSNCMPLGPRN